MTLSLVSLLSRDVTAQWLVLKTSTGVSGSAVHWGAVETSRGQCAWDEARW